MKKKILIIHPFLPYPMVSGGHQALYNGIRAVADEWDVTLVFEGIDDAETRKNIKEFSRMMPNVVLSPLLHPEPKPAPEPQGFKLLYRKLRRIESKIKSCLKTIITKKETPQSNNISSVSPVVNVERWKFTVTPSSQAWINHIYKISRENHYDIIQIEMPWRISDVFAIPGISKKVYVHHELGFVRRELELSSASNDPYFQSCKMFADMNEIGQLNLYDAVVTLSPIDARKLVENGVKVPVFSSFSIVNSTQEVKTDLECVTKLVFVGSDKHRPNLVGITWFLENCWNRLKQVDSRYCLNVIGRWESENINRFSTIYPDVSFCGFVEDLSTYLDNSIMIVPITIGSGIRMKILEAATAGVPVVTTTVGVEGIPLEHGKDCFISDDPESFVDCIVKLQPKSMRQIFSSNSKKVIQTHYTLQALQNNRLQIYNSILESAK